MPLLGKGAIAMWWNMAPQDREEFEDWHTHEHFPERMGIPGFCRGSRWASAEGGDGWFVMYELESYGTLTSPAYFARLNQPTPWSTKMMPLHRHMVRSQCHVALSHGAGIGRGMLTIRLSPAEGSADSLGAYLRRLLAELPQRRGVAAAHLLRTQTPQAASTTEQKIRGGADGVADWVVLAGGYDPDALTRLAQDDLGASALEAAGASPGSLAATYLLAHTITPADL